MPAPSNYRDNFLSEDTPAIIQTGTDLQRICERPTDDEVLDRWEREAGSIFGCCSPGEPGSATVYPRKLYRGSGV